MVKQGKRIGLVDENLSGEIVNHARNKVKIAQKKEKNQKIPCQADNFLLELHGALISADKGGA